MTEINQVKRYLALYKAGKLSEKQSKRLIELMQFDLDASEMQRAVDVMAKVFSSSTLDMNKFSESMKYVGEV